jgi:hypothetical protein
MFSWQDSRTSSGFCSGAALALAEGVGATAEAEGALDAEAESATDAELEGAADADPTATAEEDVAAGGCA